MASGTKVKKHKCSCGRSFRHAISLKRHQNVTGCKSDVEDTVEEVVQEKKALAKSADKPSSATASAAPPAGTDDRTIVITPELVAAWQQQTGFNSRPSVVDSLPPRQPARPKVDWVAVAQTSKEFLAFCGEVQAGAFKAFQNILLVLGRSALFLAVIGLTGWLMITGVAASDSTSIDEVGRSQLAAQTLVQDFLQNARLNQYKRAHDLLAPGARESVSPHQLKMMFNSLPLNETPNAWNTQISDDKSTARVVVSRAGVHEVYTVVLSNDGWGLASVSIED